MRNAEGIRISLDSARVDENGVDDVTFDDYSL